MKVQQVPVQEAQEMPRFSRESMEVRRRERRSSGRDEEVIDGGGSRPSLLVVSGPPSLARSELWRNDGGMTNGASRITS